jgi:hypothetical protein
VGVARIVGPAARNRSATHGMSATEWWPIGSGRTPEKCSSSCLDQARLHRELRYRIGCRFGADPEFDEDRPQHPDAWRQQKAVGRDRIGQQFDECSSFGQASSLFPLPLGNRSSAQPLVLRQRGAIGKDTEKEIDAAGRAHR